MEKEELRQKIWTDPYNPNKEQTVEEILAEFGRLKQENDRLRGIMTRQNKMCLECSDNHEAEVKALEKLNSILQSKAEALDRITLAYHEMSTECPCRVCDAISSYLDSQEKPHCKRVACPECNAKITHTQLEKPAAEERLREILRHGLKHHCYIDDEPAQECILADLVVAILKEFQLKED